jgi:signal transduction histidine kinase
MTDKRRFPLSAAWGITAWLLGAVLLAAVGLLWPAGPVDHVVERSWALSTDHQPPAPGTPLAGERPMGPVLSAGYGHEAVWVRLRVDPGLSPSRAGEALLLRIRPGYLDDIVMFDPLAGGRPIGPVGDRHPQAAQARPSTVFNLALAPGEQPREVWVRLRSQSTRLAHFEVLREHDLWRADARSTVWGALYLAALAMLLVWGGAQLLVRRDALAASFIALQAASLAYGASSLGFLRLFTGAEADVLWIDRLTSVMAITATGAAFTFNALLLRDMQVPRWGLWLTRGCLLLFPGLLFALALEHTVPALQLNMLLVLVGPVLFLLLALASPRGIAGQSVSDAPAARRMGLAYFWLLLLLTVLAALPGLGLVAGGRVSLYIIMLHGVVSGLLMLAMLTYRVYGLLQQRELLAAEAGYNRREVQREKAFRQDREKLLAMLAHELKTPLATVRMLLGTLGLAPRAQRAAQTAVADMNQVIERCLQVGQLDEGALRVASQPCDLAALAARVVQAHPAHARMALAVPPAAPVCTDPQLLETVLRNLVDNAAKYSPADTTVRLDLQTGADDGVELTVRNTVGPAGKPDPAQVFTKYYRHAQARRWTGSGLGLYLVSGLVQTLGGRLRYVDEGPGIAFALWLPRGSDKEAVCG